MPYALPCPSRLLRATLATLTVATLLFGPAGSPMAQPHDHAAHMAGMQAAQTNAAADTRQAVAFPAPMKEHTLTNMRDHLLALAQIQEALGRGAFDAAGQIAEQRLGMSSLQSHGAHEVAGFMPEGMQAAGQAMHRSASRFAVEAQNSSASGDVKPALAALASLTQACVACHASYRLK
ncbi:MAG: hypothetical protein RIQ60_1024 [Pseudomonadota bacterium]|jgi:cytochrome c556